MSAPQSRCPQCGAPLPVVAAEVEVLCPYCRQQVRATGAAPVRQLLLVDRAEPAEARALLAQCLASRFESPTAVVGEGRPRLIPCWSVVTADGEMRTGPATREDQALLRTLTPPSLPARPLEPDEALPPEAAPLDRALAEFVTPADPASLDRAWLVWVPVRLWQIRVGRHYYRAATVADCSTPLIEPVHAEDMVPPLSRALLLPLAGWAAGLIGLALLLPLPVHAGIAAALTAILLLLWRPFAPLRSYQRRRT